MAKRGKVTINELHCRGCGYCQEFCGRGCIEIAKGKFTPQGFPLPVLVNPNKCNACGICGWMCPHFAIEVYKYTENERAKTD